MVAPKVGDFLSATEGTVDNSMWWVNNGCISTTGWEWQWYRDDTPITGATDKFYEVTSEDVGKVLKAKTTPIDQWFRPTNEMFTAPTDPVTAS